MKLVATVVGIVLLAQTAVYAQSGVELYLHEWGIASSTVTVDPGASIEFGVVMHTNGNSVRRVVYDLVAYHSGWSLDSRVWGIYGWIEQDNSWNQSSPLPSELPAVLDDSLHGLGGSPVDFRYDTYRDNGSGQPGTPISGSFVAERFQLTVPGDTAAGDYTLSIKYAATFDEFDVALPTTVDADFVVTVNEISEPVPGDADDDDDVDLDDFIILKQNFGMTTAATSAQGDFDGDGDVDLDDFTILKNNFGTERIAACDPALPLMIDDILVGKADGGVAQGHPGNPG